MLISRPHGERVGAVPPLMTSAARNKMQVAFAVFVSAFILGTRFNFFGISANLSIVGLAGIFSLQVVVFTRDNIARYTKAAPYLALCVLLALYSAAMQYGLHGNKYEFYFLRLSVNYTLYILTAVAACNVINALKMDFAIPFLIIFYTVAINALIILLEFNFPVVRIAIEGFLAQAEGSNIDYLHVGWRLRGIAAEGGASLSVFMALGIAAGAVAVHRERLSALIFLIGSLITLAAMITVARTGLYIGLALLAVFICVHLATNFGKYSRHLAIVAFLGIGYFISASQNYSAVAPWAYELFINLYQTGELGTASTDELRAMYSSSKDALNNAEPPLPIDLQTSDAAADATERIGAWRWVVGIGFFDGDAPYRNDSGYMKTIYSVGGLAALMIYGLFAFHLLFRVSRNLGGPDYIWIIFVAALFLAELKEPLFYQNYTGRSLILIIMGAHILGMGRRPAIAHDQTGQRSAHTLG